MTVECWGKNCIKMLRWSSVSELLCGRFLTHKQKIPDWNNRPQKVALAEHLFQECLCVNGGSLTACPLSLGGTVRGCKEWLQRRSDRKMSSSSSRRCRQDCHSRRVSCVYEQFGPLYLLSHLLAVFLFTKLTENLCLNSCHYLFFNFFFLIFISR